MTSHRGRVPEAVEASETGVAAAFLSVARLIGGGIGSPLAAAILAANVVVPGASSVAAFEATFWIAAGISFAGSAFALLVPGEPAN